MRTPRLTHGRKGYIYHHCRCEVCLAAHRQYSREYQRRRREEAAKGGRPFGRTRTFVETIGFHYVLPGDWVADAACKGNTICEIPHCYTAHTRRWPGLIDARALCDDCPVLEQCRSWVLAHNFDPCRAHVVAGMTPKERNTERRNRGMRVPGNPGRGNAA